MKGDRGDGGLNAGLAQLLTGIGRVPTFYVASQAIVLGRAGLVFIGELGNDLWMGGDAVTCIEGTVSL